MARLSVQNNNLFSRLPQREVGRFIKFAIVGALGAVIHLSVLNVLNLVLGVPKEIANPIAFSTAVTSNFIWNRLWTYPESRSRSIRSQLPKFFLVNVIGLAINQTILLLMHDHVLAGFHLADALALNVSAATAMGVVMFWNFFVNRIWTYRGL